MYIEDADFFMEFLFYQCESAFICGLGFTQASKRNAGVYPTF